MESKKGYIHVYTGNGKGKTTSSIGLMVRAVGAGKSVYFGQFMKGGNYSEIKMLKERFPEIEVVQYGGGILIDKKAQEDDIAVATEGFKLAREAVLSGKYDMVVLDEINVANHMGMIDTNDILDLFNNKPEQLEIILTGRYANQSIIDKADLVSEIMQIKHYFNVGVPARSGIEM